MVTITSKHAPLRTTLLVLGLFNAGASTAAPAWTSAGHQPPRYKITQLERLGGTSAIGVSINDLGVVAGRSNLPGGIRHAALWRNGALIPRDLGTLGGPDKTSTVPWPVKNLRGIVSGISYTDEPDPNLEDWSCSAFIASSGTRCLGFRWENGLMTALLPFPGGTHSFATGTNNLKQTVGWAENGVVDPTCAGTQKLQFRAAIWGANGKISRELPPLEGADANGIRDTSSAATAINDSGMVVGISGLCDVAVGRLSARHAVLWEKARPVDIGNLGVLAWNTPNMINQRGDIVGFAPIPDADPSDDLDSPTLRAFLKLRGRPMQNLGTLTADGLSSNAASINEWRQVVGDSCDPDGCRAFLWQNGTMYDLNALSVGSDDVLTLAKDIDNFGRITGQGFDDETGTFFAFVATPIW
jgi:probable HAF family extracellular repeat protein